MNYIKKDFLKSIFSVGILTLIGILQSCERLDLVRMLDTSTDSVSVEGTTVIVHGTVLDLGGSNIVSHGHCWATQQNPSIGDSHSDLGIIEGTGDFYSRLSGIKPGIKHYVRSYIFDGENYLYGDTISFEIRSADINFQVDSIKKVKPGTVRFISSTQGIGSLVFSDFGHCWSQTGPPTINNNATSFGAYSSDIVFSSTFDNLTEGRYYIRGYLENEGVVVYTDTYVYESQISVETESISMNLDRTIAAYGNIVSLGMKDIVDHGFCWSRTTSSPTINSENSSLGPVSNLGSYSYNITGADAGSKYFIRSYATDGINIFYGKIKSITAK